MASITKAALIALLAAAPQAQAATLTTLASIAPSSGAEPLARPLLAPSGLLYGTTIFGGANGGGLLYSFNPTTATYAQLQQWTTYGIDGTTPAGTLLLSKKGVLYGITEQGGSGSCHSGCGTLWSYDTVKSIYTTLYHFTGGADGWQPLAGLAFDAKQKTLYGTTDAGGSTANCTYGCGTIFAYSLAAKTLTTLHAFDHTDGDGPGSRPLLIGTLLYGTTGEGGAHNSGEIWQMDPSSSAFTVLHNFDYDVDGYNPDADLLVLKGVLYGETYAGGPTSTAYGTLFSYNIATTALATLYTFQDTTDGLRPQGGLGAIKTKLYGTAGSANGYGEIFSFSLKKSKLTIPYVFTGGANGAEPQTGLTPNGTGSFYGTTSFDPGTIFYFTP